MTRTIADKSRIHIQRATQEQIAYVFEFADPEAMALLGTAALQIRHALYSMIPNVRLLCYGETILGLFALERKGVYASNLMALPTVHAVAHRTELVKGGKELVRELSKLTPGSLVMSVSFSSDRDRKFAKALGFKPGYADSGRLLMVYEK